MVKKMSIYGRSTKTRSWPERMVVLVCKGSAWYTGTKSSMHQDKQFWDNAVGESYVSHKSAMWSNQKNYGLSTTEK